MNKFVILATAVLMIMAFAFTACAPAAPEPVEEPAPVEEPGTVEEPAQPEEPEEVDEADEVAEEVDEEDVDVVEKTVLPEMTKVSWHTDWFYSTDQAAFWSADFHGFFAERNLELEVIEGGPGIRPANDVALGNVDFALALAENIVLAEAAGAELLAFFATFQESQLGVMVHESSGVTTLEELIDPENEMYVSMFPGQVFWEVLKFEHGFTIEEIAHDGSITAWTVEPNRAQQAMGTTNPYHVKVADPDAKPVFLSANALGFNSYTHVYFTSRQFAEENPLVVRAFAEALQEGLEAFFEDPEPVVQHIHEVREDFEVEVGMAAYEEMKKFCFSETTDRLGLGAMEGDIWRDISARMYAAGIISVEIDPEIVWTNEFLPTVP